MIWIQHIETGFRRDMIVRPYKAYYSRVHSQQGRGEHMLRTNSTAAAERVRLFEPD
jgi:hypothetical protein